jgi:hypothetical protein
LHSFLLRNHFLLPEDLKRFFINPMIDAVGAFAESHEGRRRDILTYLLSLFRFLTECAGSQRTFIDAVVAPGQSNTKNEQLENALRKLIQQNFTTLPKDMRPLALKTIAALLTWLSITASKRIALPFLTRLFELRPASEQKLNSLALFMENLIKPLITR